MENRSTGRQRKGLANLAMERPTAEGTKSMVAICHRLPAAPAEVQDVNCWRVAARNLPVSHPGAA